MLQSCTVNCHTPGNHDFLKDIRDPKNCVYIYYGYSDKIDDNLLKELMNSVSSKERERAERFHFRRDMINHIVSRAIVRNLIAGRQKCEAHAVDIRLSVNEKPFIPGNNLHFNIAHSSELFAVAFTETGETGLDVEFINPELDYKAIISGYFSENERKSILSAGEKSRERFFLYWTRKEALLKAMGLGITQDLTRIEILNGENEVHVKDASISIEKEYHIHSVRLDHYYLSLALSMKCHPRLAEVKYDPEFFSFEEGSH